MMTGIPQVVFLKYFMSFGRCQRSLLSLPMALFVDAATMREMIIVLANDGPSAGEPVARLDSYRGFYGGMGLVIFKGEVLEPELEDILHRGIEFHRGQGIRAAGELQPCLFEMIAIQVHIAKGVDEFSGLESADLGDHQGQQGIGRDVEGYPEEDIGAALIELATEPLFAF